MQKENECQFKYFGLQFIDDGQMEKCKFTILKIDEKRVKSNNEKIDM